MDDIAGARLRELLSRYGPDLAENPGRLRALLNDVMPENRREVLALVAAAEEGIPAELTTSSRNQSTAAVGPQLSRRLARDRAMDPAAADWAVATWAEALSLETAPVRTVVSDPGGETVLDPGSSGPPDRRPPPPGTTSSRIPWLVGGGAVAVLAAFLLITNLPGGEPGSSVPPASIEPFSEPPASIDTFSEPPPSIEPASGLLARVPSDLRDRCDEEDPGFVVAAVSCSTGDGTSVTYWEYSALDEMYQEYDRVVTQAGVARGAGSCPDTIPAESTWNYETSTEDEVVGRLVCYREPDGTAWIETTHDALLIYYWAFRTDGDMSRLFDDWVERLGPLGD